MKHAFEKPLPHPVIEIILPEFQRGIEILRIIAGGSCQPSQLTVLCLSGYRCGFGGYPSFRYTRTPIAFFLCHVSISRRNC